VAAGAGGVDLGVEVGDVGRPGAAVAGDHGGDALGDVGQVGAGGGAEDRPVAVGVQVDEAGGDDQAGAVEDARLAGDFEPAGGDRIGLGEPESAPRRLANMIEVPSVPTLVLSMVDVLLCPYCAERPADSDDHVFPQFLGGKATILACTTCNNTFGHSFEAST